jgi:hypothetical protein
MVFTDGVQSWVWMRPSSSCLPAKWDVVGQGMRPPSLDVVEGDGFTREGLQRRTSGFLLDFVIRRCELRCDELYNLLLVLHLRLNVVDYVKRLREWLKAVWLAFRELLEARWRVAEIAREMLSVTLTRGFQILDYDKHWTFEGNLD